jgi:hypothetical protein
MISGADLRAHLDVLAEKYPNSVISNLSQGDTVQRVGAHRYAIDDISIVDTPIFDPNSVSLHANIYDHFKHKQVVLPTPSKPWVTPFSEVFNARRGLCLEQSIVRQLIAQKNGPSYLINGVLGNEDEVGVENHAFNVVFHEDQPFLEDTLNPLRSMDEDVRGTDFAVRILNVLDSEQNFELPGYACFHGRNYSIF